MSIALLIKNEYIKTTRRLAFVVIMSFYMFLLLMVNMSNMQDALRHGNKQYGLPQAWPSLLNDAGIMSLFFAAIIIMLLVAAEFSWKTARQNVIDGLSKNQWFVGKVLLTIGICVAFEVLVLGMGGTFAASVSFTKFARPQDYRMMGAYSLAMLGFASTALMLSMLLRNAGPALAALFAWMAVVENLISMILIKINKDLWVVARKLPFKVFTDLLDENYWNPEKYQQALAAAKKFHRPPPFRIEDVHALYWFAAGYIVLFTMIAYVSYRRRDL